MLNYVQGIKYIWIWLYHSGIKATSSQKWNMFLCVVVSKILKIGLLDQMLDFHQYKVKVGTACLGNPYQSLRQWKLKL